VSGDISGDSSAARVYLLLGILERPPPENGTVEIEERRTLGSWGRGGGGARCRGESAPPCSQACPHPRGGGCSHVCWRCANHQGRRGSRGGVGVGGGSMGRTGQGEERAVTVGGFWAPAGIGILAPSLAALPEGPASLLTWQTSA